MMHDRCLPHYGEQKIERLPCMSAAADAIALSNRVAFTSAHPARVAAEAMIQHLTDTEAAHLVKRGHVLTPVIGRGLMVCLEPCTQHVRAAGERCERGR